MTHDRGKSTRSGGSASARTGRNPAATGESPGMRSDSDAAPSDERFAQARDLERRLLRVGVGLLSAERTNCRDCGRTPLIGEEVHLYERGAVVCELCRPRHAAAPISIERIRHSEFGQTVRLKRAA
jgi:hypothetical protein